MADTRSGGRSAGSNFLTVAMWVSLICFMLCLSGYALLTRYAKEHPAVEPVPAAAGEERLYTQEYLDQRVAEAARTALADGNIEIEEAYEQGVEAGRKGVLDTIRELLSGGMSVLEVLRPLYDEEVVVVSNKTFHFVPIQFNLKLSEMLQERLSVLENGEFTYLGEDGETVISHKGIDVSQHQGKINWEKVADEGVEFALIRSIYRGYGSGKLVEDSTYEDNMEGAIANGIHVGTYVFTQAISEEEMLEEAEIAIERAKPYGTGFPIVIDVERVEGENPRMDALTKEERTDLVLLFCKTVEDAGYLPMIYYNTEMSLLYMEVERLEEIPKWFASYTESLFYPYSYNIWQYSPKGSVSGIKGEVDMNICLDPFWE